MMIIIIIFFFNCNKDTEIQKNTETLKGKRTKKSKLRLLTSTYVILIYNYIIAYNLHY